MDRAVSPPEEARTRTDAYAERRTAPEEPARQRSVAPAAVDPEPQQPVVLTGRFDGAEVDQTSFAVDANGIAGKRHAGGGHGLEPRARRLAERAEKMTLQSEDRVAGQTHHAAVFTPRLPARARM